MHKIKDLLRQPAQYIKIKQYYNTYNKQRHKAKLINVWVNNMY